MVDIRAKKIDREFKVTSLRSRSSVGIIFEENLTRTTTSISRRKLRPRGNKTTVSRVWIKI